jgi:hypothetical protein
MGRFVGVLALVWLFLSSGSAHAEEAQKGVLVLDVAPEAELDPQKLRAEVGTELSMEVVAAEDPNAEHAKGEIDVSVNPETKKLVVVYRKMGEPLRREVVMPLDPARRASTVVVLAGNLARDEAEDVLAEMRKNRPPPPPPKAAPTRASFADESTAPAEKAEPPLPTTHTSVLLWSGTYSLVNFAVEIKSPRFRTRIGSYGELFFMPTLSAAGPHAPDRAGFAFEAGYIFHFGKSIPNGYFSFGLGCTFGIRFAAKGNSTFCPMRLKYGVQVAEHFGIFVGTSQGPAISSGDRDLETPWGFEAFAGLHF